MKSVLACLVILVASTCLALQPPPPDAESQRAWLAGHLVADMQVLDTFSPADFGKVSDTIAKLTDDQVGVASQLYYLTRAKTEQDASLYARQQAGESDEQVNEAKAQVADLLTTMHEESVASYEQLVAYGQPYLAQMCYATVPGWCVSASVYCPEWYYNDGYYVGGCYDRGYCGDWAAPIYRAYYDQGSGFYSRYRANWDNYRDHSLRVAQRRSHWYRNHDYQHHFKHDRYDGKHHDGKRYDGKRYDGKHNDGKYDRGQQPKHVAKPHAPRGAKPQAHAPRGAKPKAHAPRGAKPQAHAPRGAKPQAHAPRGAKPKAHAPRGAKPKAHAPRGGAKPKAHAPRGGAKRR